MKEFYYQAAFQIFPYICLVVFFGASWFRYDRAMFTWRTGSSQLVSRKGMRIGSNLFHIGILGLLAGHVAGLFTPHFVYAVLITAAQKQLLEMIIGGFFSVLCLIGITILIYRRLFNVRVSATSMMGDKIVLLLLGAQLLLGMAGIFESRNHMDGKQIVALADWAQYIVTFRLGAAEFIKGSNWVYQAHIILGMALLLVAPFTRLVHAWSIPINYLWRPYQIVRRRQQPLNYRGRGAK